MVAIHKELNREIFQLLKGSGRTLSLYDEHAQKIFEPDDAVSFYSIQDNTMVTIDNEGSDRSINLYLSGTTDTKQMTKLIDTLRKTATKFNYLFNIKKYGKDLKPKDFVYRAEPVTESVLERNKMSFLFENNIQVKSFDSSNKTLIKELVESLEGEFGFKRGSDFFVFGKSVLMLDESKFAKAKLFVESTNGYQINESADKFLIYANQWVRRRVNAAHKGLEISKNSDELDKEANELANGLKDLYLGRLHLNVRIDDSLATAPEQMQISSKLDKVLAPGSGLTNDSLWNYFDIINHKIENGIQLIPNEQFFTKKIIELVDKLSMGNYKLPEERDLEEWSNSFDNMFTDELDEADITIDDDDDDDYDHNSSLIISEIENFDFADFMQFSEADFTVWADEEPVSKKFVEIELKRYLAQKLEIKPNDLSMYSHKINNLLKTEVMPKLNEHGVNVSIDDISHNVTERDESDETIIDDPEWNRNEETELAIEEDMVSHLKWMLDNPIGPLADALKDKDNVNADTLADDMIEYFSKDIAKDNGAEWGVEYIETQIYDHLKSIILPVLKSKYQFSDGTLDEDVPEVIEGSRNIAATGANSLNKIEVDKKFDKILANTKIGNNQMSFVNTVMSELKDYYSYSIAFTKIVNSELRAYANKANEFWNSKQVKENDEIYGADKGDDFIDDVTYKPKNKADVEEITRMRKLAGI
jgi:hypothetical protein